MERIAVFGGTFNPIHLGHLRLISEYQRQYHFDRVLLIPTKIPPHKQANELAPDADRLEMCRIAARAHPFLEVSELELHREGKSYTYDTLCAIKQKEPDAELYLIMGSDMFLTFRQWRRWREMLGLAVLLAAPRHPGERAALEAEREQLCAEGGEAYVADIPVLEVSSTELRGRLRKGLPCGEYLLPEVEAYIRDHRLYALPAEAVFPFSEEDAVELLKERLKPDRLQHSLNVAEQAAWLAKRYHYDEKIAKMTGLLHDVCKNDNLDNQLQIIHDGDIILKNVERESPPLYHAIAGAVYLRDRLRITDPDVLNAVRYHTTGRAGMSRLEKIIYIADLTSRERSYPDVETVRTLAGESLEAAMLYALEFLLCDLVGRKQYLHPDSVEAYNELRFWQGRKSNS